MPRGRFRRNARHDVPRSFSRGNIRGGVSYYWITPESAKEGMYEDADWERGPEPLTFREATELLKSYEPYDSVERLSHDTLVFRCADEELHKDGTITSREVTLFFEDAITKDRLLAWWKSYTRRQASRFGAW